MNERANERWKKYHNKGKYSFIFRIGGFYFGILIMGILIPLAGAIISFWQHSYSFEFITGEFIGQNIIRLILAYPFGLLWGWVMWTWAEWRYSPS